MVKDEIDLTSGKLKSRSYLISKEGVEEGKELEKGKDLESGCFNILTYAKQLKKAIKEFKALKGRFNERELSREGFIKDITKIQTQMKKNKDSLIKSGNKTEAIKLNDVYDSINKKLDTVKEKTEDLKSHFRKINFVVDLRKIKQRIKDSVKQSI